MGNDTVLEVTPEIIFENESLAVINKPAGLIVHSDGRTEEPSLADWVVRTWPQTAEVGEPWVSPQGEVIARPGIVHRLDRTTSGIMVVAKTTEAYTFLKEQFQSRALTKEYRAFVYGHPKKDSGTIEAEITRIRAVPPRWGVKRAGESKKHREAVTDWRVGQRGRDAQTNEPVSYMELSPKTGRTHQLRVHLKHLGYPIICDPLYAPGRECLLEFVRPALHAFRLTFMMLGEGECMFEAPLPPDFENALVRIAE